MSGCTSFTKITRGGSGVWWECHGCGKQFVSETLWTRHAESEALIQADKETRREEHRRQKEERQAREKFLDDLERLRETARLEAFAEVAGHLENLAAAAEEALAQNGGDGPATQRVAGRADGLRLAFNAAASFAAGALK